MTVPLNVFEVAQRTLTPAQMAAWHLEAKGHSQRTIATALGISRSALLDRLDNAHRQLLKAGVRMDASGNYYHQETA